MGGIMAFNVEGRIGLGIAEPLRIRETVLEADAFRFHARQDVVARTVQDAEDTADLVSRQRLAKRLDDGNATSYGRLIVEEKTVFLGNCRKFNAVLGKKSLVGCYDMLAGLKRCLHGCEGRTILP